MTMLIGAWGPGEKVCDVCQADDLPMIQMDVDGTEQSGIACVLCVADALERASGWRVRKMFEQFALSSRVGQIVRADNKERRAAERQADAEAPTSSRPKRGKKLTLAEFDAMREAGGETETAGETDGEAESAGEATETETEAETADAAAGT